MTTQIKTDPRTNQSLSLSLKASKNFSYTKTYPSEGEKQYSLCLNFVRSCFPTQMSKLCVFLILLHLSHLGHSISSSDLFQSWCKQYNKTYPSEEERQYRLRVFEDNLAFINEHNSLGNSTYTLDLNAYADLTHHEFKATKLGLPLSANGLIRLKRGDPVAPVGEVGIPDSVDWRKEGAVTKVKDQGSCGACWSFAATGAMEGINKIATGSLVSLSEQELIDCDRSFNDGCDGGLMDYAYEFVVQNHGIDTEDDYPYLARQKSCNRNKLNRHVVTIDGYVDVPPNEEALLKAVATQPVSVGICGSERSFQLYSKGIFSGPCSASLDHAVLIVGYDSENGVDYWIVKNSWGTSWGMDGYIYMQRGSGSSAGVCGINQLASYPTKTSPNPPPPPPPGPTMCSLFSYCAAGETCCCARSFLGLCLSWRCCELNSAVCCKDRRHCCPQDYPVCDTQRNLCLKKTGNTTAAKAMNSGHSSLQSVVGEIPMLRM